MQRVIASVTCPPDVCLAGAYWLQLQNTNAMSGSSQAVSLVISSAALEKGTDDSRHPAKDRRYEAINTADLPMTESLKQTTERVLPYWHNSVLPAVQAGKTCIIVGHGNSIRVSFSSQLCIAETATVNTRTTFTASLQKSGAVTEVCHAKCSVPRSDQHHTT